LEGAREAGGTKTCTGAIAKQKTAEPQGAASPSLAVLESDGRKREVSTDNAASVAVGRREEIYRTQKALGLSHDWGLESETRVQSAIQLKLAAALATTPSTVTVRH